VTALLAAYWLGDTVGSTGWIIVVCAVLGALATGACEGLKYAKTVAVPEATP
jgi:hypothetical protein